MIALFLSVVVGLVLEPAVGATDLNVPIKAQEHTYWCWAAASQAVLDYYGTVAAQCDMPDVIYHHTYGDNISSHLNCCGSYYSEQNCDFTIDMIDLGLVILPHWGVSAVLEGPLPQATYIAEIDAGRPFVMGLAYSTGGGHAVVGRGYYAMYVDYMDPAQGLFGGYKTALYTSLVAQNASMRWAATAQITTNVRPTCETGYASSVSTSGATLNATVNANNTSTTVTFEYGTSTSYGNEVSADQNPVTGDAVAVSKSITNLSNGTLYHFRVKAVSGGLTYYGNDQTFTTGVNQTSGGVLTIVNIGTGAGTVNRIVNGTVMCNSYTLEAVPALGSAFTGWSGDCRVDGATCETNDCINRTVYASFTLLMPLTISKSGNGTGTVTSTSPASPVINCGSTCSNSYLPNTTVALVATPDPGKIFKGWSGACSGRDICTVNMTSAQSVNATFIYDITPIINLLLND